MREEYWRTFDPARSRDWNHVRSIYLFHAAANGRTQVRRASDANERRAGPVMAAVSPRSPRDGSIRLGEFVRVTLRGRFRLFRGGQVFRSAVPIGEPVAQMVRGRNKFEPGAVRSEDRGRTVRGA